MGWYLGSGLKLWRKGWPVGVRISCSAANFKSGEGRCPDPFASRGCLGLGAYAFVNGYPTRPRFEARGIVSSRRVDMGNGDFPDGPAWMAVGATQRFRHVVGMGGGKRVQARVS